MVYTSLIQNTLHSVCMAWKVFVLIAMNWRLQAGLYMHVQYDAMRTFCRLASTAE